MFLLPFCQDSDKRQNFRKFEILYFYSLSFYNQKVDPEFMLRLTPTLSQNIENAH